MRTYVGYFLQKGQFASVFLSTISAVVSLVVHVVVKASLASLVLPTQFSLGLFSGTDIGPPPPPQKKADQELGRQHQTNHSLRRQHNLVSVIFAKTLSNPSCRSYQYPVGSMR